VSPSGCRSSGWLGVAILLGRGPNGNWVVRRGAASAFHLLTGSPPFQNSNPVAVISQHLTSSPPKLGDYRHELVALNDVFATALAKDPAQRYPNCTEFARDLERRVAGASTAPDVATQAAVPSPALAAAAPRQAARIPAVLPSSPSPLPSLHRTEPFSPRLSRRASWAVAVSRWRAVVRLRGEPDCSARLRRRLPAPSFKPRRLGH
jgi:serine/threonine protein kinase